MTVLAFKRFFIVLLTFLSLNLAGNAQDTIVISFDCSDVMFGEEVCIPVQVDNFTDVTVFSLLITWDPLVLAFNSIQNEEFTGFEGSTWNLAGPNDLRYLWVNPDISGSGVTLPDGTVLFEICFDAVGIPGSTSIINAPAFVLNPFNTTEFADPDAEAIPFVSIPCFVEVTQPVTVTAIISTCGSPDGVSNGSFTITGAGGAPPYSYMWTGPVNGSGILVAGAEATQFVPPGTYTITITDALGAMQVYMITISTAEMMPVITIVRQVTCYDFSNGRIEVGAFGGTHPISVIWVNNSNPVFAGSGFLTDPSDVMLLNSLPVGDYTITLIDDSGCKRQSMVSLAADPILIDVTVDDATCLGATDGSATISFSGGRPYQGGIYEISSSWGSGGSVQTTSPISTPLILGPGDYWVEVCDSINGCCVRDTFEVGAETIISADLLVTGVSCVGSNDGMVRIAGLTNGLLVPDYTIELFNANLMPIGAPQVGVSVVMYNMLATGTYYTVVSQDECISDTISFEIPPAIPIVINVLSVKPSGCISGQGTGEISVMASGGTPGYSYSWDGGALSGATVTGVTAGNHVVTVTDSNGCTKFMTINVPQAVGPQIDTIIASNIGCTPGNATLEVIFTQGTAPVTVIDWSTGDTTAIITGVDPDTVTVLIRDSLFCFDLASFIVPDQSIITLDSVQIRNPTCIGDTDGQITVFVSQGLLPYTYIWSTGDTTNFNLLPGLGAGTYSVTVVDADTCDVFVDTTLVLSDPVAPAFSFTVLNEASCSDSCDGSATLIPMGGIPGMPFTFFWDAGLMETGTQSTIQDLCAGFQRVVITQDDLCFYEDSVFIDAPLPIGLDTLALSHVSCFGNSDGSLMLMGTGGTAPYVFSWNTLPNGPNQNQLAAGIYDVTITDDNGCSFEHSLEILEPDSLSLSIDSSGLSPVSCNSMNSGVITLSVFGGSGGYTYTWDPPVSTSFIATGVTSGLYHITVTDASGCTDSTSIQMFGPSPVMSVLPPVADPLCFGGLTPVTVESATGGNGGFTWSVNGGAANPLDSLVFLPAGIYNIITQDSTGCRDTVQIFIDNPPPLEIVILPEDPIIKLGDSIMLQVLIQGMQVQIDSVSWVSNGPLSCYDCPEPIAMNVIPTVYTVTVWDENGCSATLDVLVDVDNQREVFIPTIFSPNFDGRNDQLIIFTGQGITGIPSMRIFDRWGEVLVEQTDLPAVPGGLVVWDGSFNNKMMPPGVYIYFIEVEFANGEVLRYHGDVTLVR